MNSIYEQMNKIDDTESLNEKYNVRTLKDVKKLTEATAPKADRSSIKTRVNELIDMVDWSTWEKFTSTGDDTKPEVKKTKATDDGIRVDVYLGWDYGHNDDIEEYVKAVKEKFEAFAAIVRKQEPSWSVKLVKGQGSRGVTWTNYWAQVTAKLSMTDVKKLKEYWEDDIEENELSASLLYDAASAKGLSDFTIEDAGDETRFSFTYNDDFYTVDMDRYDTLVSDESEALNVIDKILDRAENLDEALSKTKPTRSSGYAYSIRDIRSNATKISNETNKHEQKRQLKDLTSGCRITINEVDDLISRLTKYSDALHKFVSSSRSDLDAKTLADELENLSV